MLIKLVHNNKMNEILCYLGVNILTLPLNYGKSFEGDEG